MTGGLPLYAVAADFDHDGKPDVATLVGGSQVSTVLISRGNGDGTFAMPLILPVADGTVDTLAAPDVNGDGIPDLAVMSATNIYVYIGKGDGTFPSPPLALSATNPAVAFGDFNADGKLDMVYSTAGSSTLFLLPGKGDGTFGPAIMSALPSPALGYKNDIVAADFDGDILPPRRSSDFGNHRKHGAWRGRHLVRAGQRHFSNRAVDTGRSHLTCCGGCQR